MTNQQKSKGFLYVLLSGFGFGFIGFFSRHAFQSGMQVGELLFWRFLTASVILGTTLFVVRRQWLKLSMRQILISAILGCLGYAVFSSFYFKAIEGLSIPLAVMLLFTFPLFVNIGSFIFLKEPLSKMQVLSLGIASGGLILLLWGPIAVESNIAIFYGLGASITYAVYVLVSGQLQKNVNPLASSFYVILAAALTLFLFHHPNPAEITDFSITQILCILGLSIICTIGPLSLFLAGMQYIPSSQASIIVMIEPVVATLLAWIFFAEALSSFQMAGAIVVLAAMVLNSRG